MGTLQGQITQCWLAAYALHCSCTRSLDILGAKLTKLWRESHLNSSTRRTVITKWVLQKEKWKPRLLDCLSCKFTKGRDNLLKSSSSPMLYSFSLDQFSASSYLLNVHLNNLSSLSMQFMFNIYFLSSKYPVYFSLLW